MSRKVVMQQHDPDEAGLFSLATFQTLRLEALDLFDRSLAESRPELLEHFLEYQVAQKPPPLELLSQIAEDVHQRLLSLRQRHFDARDEMRLMLQRQYALDLTPFLPNDPVEYHRLNLEAAMNFFAQAQPPLSEESSRILREMLEEALSSAAAQHAEMALADRLYTYIMDWLMALHVVTVRGAWSDDPWADEPPLIH
jgi:hypothetical protein